MNETPTPKRLLRSTDDRVVAGVAGGLGHHFGIDPVIFRIGLAALAFVGGLGIVAYLGAWLFVPEDDGQGQPKPVEWTGRRKLAAAGAAVVALIALGSGPFWFFWAVVPDDPWGWAAGSVLLVVLLAALGVVRLFTGGGAREPLTLRRVAVIAAVAVAAISVAGVLAAGSAWATAEGGGTYVAAGVLVIGVAMVAMSFAGGAAWLALPALALAIPAGAVAASDFELDGGYGQRSWRPLSFGSVPAGGYEHAVGEATVDLRELPWRRGSSLSLEANQGIGHLRVLVPENVCVQVDGHVDGGAIYLRGDESGGADYEMSTAPPPGPAPTLRLDAELGFGLIEVADEDTGGGRWHDEDDEEREAARQRADDACLAGEDR
jgi:phage shock protein PspC (stress-responsive transcriptional regulator)